MRSAHLSRLGAVVLAWGAISGAAVSLARQARAAEPAAEPAATGDGPVFWIPIDDGPEAVPGGMMDRMTVNFVRRQVESAKQAGASVIVFHIKTFGGDSRAMIYIAKAIREARPIPTVAFVDDWALSAGALITIACDTIYMEAASTMGAAQGILVGKDGSVQTAPEKFASVFRAFFRVEVERRASRSEFPESVTAIAEAMTDPEVEVLAVKIDGVKRFVRRSRLGGTKEEGLTHDGKKVEVVRTAIAKGKLLTMTAKEAYEEYRFIDGVVEGREDVLAKIGHTETRTTVVRKSWPEEVARFIAGPLVSGFLISVAMIGLLMSLYASGKGLGGLVFVFAAGLFFWSHALAGEAGPVEIVLFLLGVALLALEAFVIPGFGIAGIGGIVLILAGLVGSFIPQGTIMPGVEGVPFPWESLGEGVASVFLAMVFSVAALALIMRLLPRLPILNRMILAQTSAGQATPVDGAAGLAGSVGKAGIASTDLRPAGKVEIEGELLDAVTDGDFIEKDAPIRAVDVSGNRLLVSDDSRGGDGGRQ